MNFKYYNTQRLILTILILSVIITPISNYIEKYITSFKDLNIIYSYIGFFSTISIISLILLLTNNLFWKYPLFRWLVDLPNLNGRYEGVLTSSFIDPITQSQVKKNV
ncbi:hypothetical protein ABIC56_000897 [Acinetobacter bereziniae]|nr:hypothetical protein [Acinetobacter bereziniae]